MKKTVIVLLINVMIFGLLTPRIIPSAQTSSTTVQKRAAAYYFYWYRYPDRHFTDPDGSDALTDHPPDSYLVPPPDYSFADAGWHKRELLDLMDAGIEVILPVYWGDYTNTNWSQIGITKLVEAENQLLSEGKTPPKIGMFYDTTSLKIQNGGIPPDLTTLAGKQLFYKMINDFFALVPDHNMWVRMNGKPVIYLYLSSYVSKYDLSTFDYVKTQFATNFSGEIPYIVKETSWTEVTTDGEYAWGAAVYGPNFYGNLAAIGPGYDDSAVYDRNTPTIRDRECGEFYQDGWDQVIDSSATLTAVETWNEYHEGTDIADSREYARQFIDLTAVNIQKWKTTDNTNRPYAWIDLGKYSYTQGLHAANLGDGTWKTTYLAGRQAAYPDLSSQPDPSNHIYLNVDDTYILGQNDNPTQVWVTVEYFDGGNDTWFIQYDSVGPDEIPYVFKATDTIILQNTNQWKRVTFNLPDAYFANRQQNGLADLRLVIGYDGITNYFGRVWVFKTDPASLHAPNLTGVKNLWLTSGKQVDVLITPDDPAGGALSLSLDRSPAFASLIDNHNGTYTLRLQPTEADASLCAYRLRLLVADKTVPALLDAETISLRFLTYVTLLPLVNR
jgi:hypothetical protein